MAAIARQQEGEAQEPGSGSSDKGLETGRWIRTVTHAALNDGFHLKVVSGGNSIRKHPRAKTP